MSGIGGMNPLPFQIGGGPSDAELIWQQLRNAVGEGGAGPEGGIEDLWRQCKAIAIAGHLATMERAATQAIPTQAVDHLPNYEDLLAIPVEATTAERQVAAGRAWTSTIDAWWSGIREQLYAISPQLDLMIIPDEQAAVTQYGKAMGPLSGSPAYTVGPFAWRTSTAWPAFSTHDVLHVRYTLAAGELFIPASVRANVETLLNEILPAWKDFSMQTNTPFYLDGGPAGTSLLDNTAFGA